ncbi:WD40-repeat-containing domain protein [Armillaria borealis]|uniref:WD40-repeat-containing domain protein n=1 Tax=Armillaria borealis TaxID=47425 RepID=A0AA39MQ83_9AGAR|nr:WD40-repeat-containing domain protein [Armillaria borealis]
MPDADEYRCLRRLKGHNGPVNCLLFYQNGDMLASGGDDQCVRCWEVNTGRCRQELNDDRWAQVTALDFLQEDRHLNLSPILFIGTGRGVVSMYPFSNASKTSSMAKVFDFNDSVEVQALDSLNQRLAVASHSGRVKMFKIDRQKNVLEPLWTFKVTTDIPRSLLFYGNGNQQVLIHTLCVGRVLCREANTGSAVSEDRLDGGVGSGALSPDGRISAVHDISNAQFDLYDPPTSVKSSKTMSLPSNVPMVKHCLFAEEGGRRLVFGRDEGCAFVWDVGTGNHVQRLDHEEDSGTIYSVATFSSPDRYFIASGEATKDSEIYVWSKPTERVQLMREQEMAEAARAKEQANELRQAQAIQAARDGELARLGQMVQWMVFSFLGATMFGLLSVWWYVWH